MMHDLTKFPSGIAVCKKCGTTVKVCSICGASPDERHRTISGAYTSPQHSEDDAWQRLSAMMKHRVNPEDITAVLSDVVKKGILT